MKRGIALILIFAYVSGLLFAAPAPADLSFEQATAYTQQLLTVDSAFKDIDSSKFALDTEWIPKQGGQTITRPEFFKITGAVEAEHDYQAIVKRNKDLRIISWTMLGVSIASGVAGTLFLSHDFIGEPSKVVGSVLTGVSIASLIGFTVPIFMIQDEDKLFTASFAIKLANDYNDNLLQTIIAR